MSPLIRKEVRKLKGYHLSQPAHRIKLNQNESPRDLPPALKDKVLDRLRSAAWNRYPTPFCDPLRAKIAEIEGWTPEGVVVSGGSNVLIQALVVASAVGGMILTVAPGFSLYEIEGKLFGNRVVQVPLKKGGFAFPRDTFLKRMKAVRPRVIFLANPNAPTGNLFPEEDLLAVLAEAPGLVVIDEAYYPFSGQTMAGHLKKFKNLVIVRTLSKAYSLGGVRLGYLLADPEVAGGCLKVILPFSVGILSQTVGEAVLEDPGYVSGIVTEIIEGREMIYGGLKGMKGLTVFPSSANYVLFQCPGAGQVFAGLVEKGILIRNVSTKGLPNALRVSVGTREENRAFLDAMASILLNTENRPRSGRRPPSH
jgi:histidinol-phosphate aminotransferase